MFSLMPWRSNRNGAGALANRTEHPLSLFRSEFDSLFDRFFGNWPALDATWSGWGLDLDETDNEVVARVDAPGFEPGDFDIQVSGDTLKITAERKAEKGDKRTYERRFQRYVTLPAAVDADKVEAKYRNGVLELTLPKTEQARWKRIPVKG
jgi:HSP20 family protein